MNRGVIEDFLDRRGEIESLRFMSLELFCYGPYLKSILFIVDLIDPSLYERPTWQVMNL
ncbi:MAG: hypothetical protein ACKOW3_08345 [Hyphomicrobium sp.]